MIMTSIQNTGIEAPIDFEERESAIHDVTYKGVLIETLGVQWTDIYFMFSGDAIKLLDNLYYTHKSKERDNKIDQVMK